MVLKVSEILKPKSKKEIREALKKMDPVTRFCNEFSFRYVNSKTNSMKLINSILKKTPKKDGVFYKIDGPNPDKLGLFFIININVIHRKGEMTTEKQMTLKEPQISFKLFNQV